MGAAKRFPIVIAAALALSWAPQVLARPGTATVTVDLSAGRPAASFDPDQAFGAAIDGTGRGETAQLFTPFNIGRMQEAGVRTISYRLRTELGIEAWHWNPAGTWSDAAHAQGYWTSSDVATGPIDVSYGYSLPRRGDTIDQANNLGFSRLDDGDPATFWKSNPYLDARFAGDDHPQWVIFELGEPTPIDAIRIAWAQPYATHFRVQYWTGKGEYDGDWATFPKGEVQGAKGGDGVLILADRPVRTAFLRIELLTGSGTAPDGSTDIRDHLGFAIGEVYAGTLQAGVLNDQLRHGASRTSQSIIYVSSTDPWHRAGDLDRDLEQPGLDLVFRSGLTHGLATMVPAGVLYDTPENAAAEVRFLRHRGYRVTQLELGEEPDGQFVSPQDYGALYLQAATAVHAVDPGLALGGPSLQDALPDNWLNLLDGRSYARGLIDYLKQRGRLGDLTFYSFERYPYDNVCGDMSDKLRAQTAELERIARSLRADGLPAGIPWVVTEYGLSAFPGQPLEEMPGALVNADIAAQSLTLGAQGAYLFGYGPGQPFQARPCASYGALALFGADGAGQATFVTPAFQASRLMTQEWAQPGGGGHALYPVLSSELDDKGRPWVSAYAVKRPDGQWAVLMVNRDGARTRSVRLAFRSGKAGDRPWKGPVQVVQYSAAQHRWKADGPNGHPTRSDPPTRATAAGSDPLRLPPFSLTVVRGRSL